MNLRIVYVLEEPGDGWAGEEGHINAEMLLRYLPATVQAPSVLRLRSVAPDGFDKTGVADDRCTSGVGAHRAIRDLGTGVSMLRAIVTRIVIFVSLLIAIGCLLFSQIVSE
jgi:hypothetical protein